MTTLLGLRFGVGYDYFNYVKITENQLVFNFSYLSNLINQFAYWSNFPNGFMGISAYIQSIILLIVLVFNGERKYAPILFFSIPFFYIDFYTLVRQSLGVCFVLLSIKLLLQEKLKSAFLLYFIASLIHVSCLLALPIYYILKKINLGFKSFAKLTLVTLLLGIITSKFFDTELFELYRSYEQEGQFYVFITLILLLSSAFWGNKEHIKICFFGFLAAVFINFYVGYVFNRVLVFFYIPLLFSEFKFNSSIKRISFIFSMLLIFSLTLYVKVREPLNGFHQFETIF